MEEETSVAGKKKEEENRVSRLAAKAHGRVGRSVRKEVRPDRFLKEVAGRVILTFLGDEIDVICFTRSIINSRQFKVP